MTETTTHTIYVGDDLLAHSIERNELEVLCEGRMLVYKGHVYIHNGAHIDRGIINHYMFDSGLSIEAARRLDRQEAYERANTCSECGNKPRLYGNEYLLIHRNACSQLNRAPQGLVL
jgi:hypothetical protein